MAEAPACFHLVRLFPLLVLKEPITAGHIVFSRGLKQMEAWQDTNVDPRLINPGFINKGESSLLEGNPPLLIKWGLIHVDQH